MHFKLKSCQTVEHGRSVSRIFLSDFWQALPFGLTVRRSLKSYIQSKLSIRIFLVLPNASLFTIYEVNWQIGHGKWFTTNLILILSSLLLSLTVPYCTKLRFTRNPTSEVTKVVAYFMISLF